MPSGAREAGRLGALPARTLPRGPVLHRVQVNEVLAECLRFPVPCLGHRGDHAGSPTAPEGLSWNPTSPHPGRTWVGNAGVLIR
jgi:hypothetical protein